MPAILRMDVDRNLFLKRKALPTTFLSQRKLDQRNLFFNKGFCLQKSFSTGSFFRKKVLEMLDTIVELCGVDVIPVDRLVIKSAQKLVVNYDLYSADAIHAATAILAGANYFVSSDGHHLKRDLKAHMVEKGVRILTLSEVEEIEKVIE